MSGSCGDPFRFERSKDGVADKFGDLRDYGVSEGSIAVCPVGNPMTCSAVSGTGYLWPSTRLHQSCQLFLSGFLTPRRGERRPPLNAVALGVGHNPNAVPKLSGTSVGSRYAMPFSIIPERGQVSENVSEPSTKQSCDVLHDDELGSYLANESGELRPEPASFASKTLARARQTDVLAREAANDAIRFDSVMSERFGRQSANISVAGDVGPVLGEDAAGELFDFAEGDGLETACAFEAKAKPSYAGKQVEDAQLAHATAPAGACAHSALTAFV